MAVSLFPEARKQAWSSIRRFCAETLDLDVPVDDHQAAALLAFFLKTGGVGNRGWDSLRM